jgi:signal transduction histidine kinase
MEQYILPLFCLLLNFAAVAACLRFLCAKEGFYWIFPLILSLLFFFQNGSTMYANGALVAPAINAGSAVNALIAIFWYLVVITFHYALKKMLQQNDYQERVRKDLEESRFLLKSEGRIQRSEEKQRIARALGRSTKVVLDCYPASWCDYFDQR